MNMYTEIRNIPEDIKSQREKFSVYFTLSVVTNPFRGLFSNGIPKSRKIFLLLIKEKKRKLELLNSASIA